MIDPAGSIPLTTLDALARAGTLGKRPIGLIKIDVEGMEEAVVEGALETIRLHLPILSVELPNKTELKRVADLLRRDRYNIIRAFNSTPTFVFAHEHTPAGARSNLIRGMRQMAAYYVEYRALQSQFNALRRKLRQDQQ